MGYFLDSTVVDLLIVLTTVLVSVFMYFQYSVKYWERRNIPSLNQGFPKFVGGRSLHFSLVHKVYYDELEKRQMKYAGVTLGTRQILVIRDPDLIKDILTKDFEYFTNRQVYYQEKTDPISAHLFSLRGERWRNLRQKLTPTFTSGKIKSMFPALVELSKFLVQAFDEAAQKKGDIDIFEFSAKFTTDVICSCAFGLESNTFGDPNSEFRSWSKKIMELGSLSHKLSIMLIANAPQLAYNLGVAAIRRDLSNYFHNLVANTIKYRKDNNKKRPDFLQSLVELQENTAGSDNAFTLEQIVAQVFLFFIAGFDTSSSAISYCLYELCKNPQMQLKVKEEIDSVLEKYNGELKYDALAEFKYLEQVIDETLRLYPPLVNLDRTCVKDYKMRNGKGTIGKGAVILISLVGIHRDAEFYPDPEKFDPERFSAENKKERHPYLHIPFGDGPRNCIGKRFGVMQTKIALIQILRNFRLTVSPSTKKLTYKSHGLFLKPKHPVYLLADKI